MTPRGEKRAHFVPKNRATLLALAALCACAIVAGLSFGSSGVAAPWPLAGEAIAALRAPRVFLAAIVGAALAIAGAAMQALLRSDLADPYVLGLSGGASAGAVASLFAWPGLPPGPLAGLGAALAALLVRSFTRGAHDPTRLLLAGIAISSVLTSLTGLILVLAPSSRLLRSATFWLFGGFGTPSWRTFFAPLALFLLTFAWLYLRAERLDRLVLGDDIALALGVDVRRLARGVIASSVALTAVAVSAGGLVGFVGLIAPHAARRLVGEKHRAVLPAAALLGAFTVVAADTIARTAFAPKEVPVGLLTAAVGGPFFLLQLGRGTR